MRYLWIVGIVFLFVTTGFISGCPGPLEESGKTVDTADTVSEAPGGENGDMIETADSAAQGDKEPESAKPLVKPYLTISAMKLPENPDEMKLWLGYPLPAFWELEEPLSETAWIGLVPKDTPKTSAASREAAITWDILDGQTMGQQQYMTMVTGWVEWRIFPSDDPEAGPFLISEAIEVCEAPDKKEEK